MSISLKPKSPREGHREEMDRRSESSPRWRPNGHLEPSGTCGVLLFTSSHQDSIANVQVRKCVPWLTPRSMRIHIPYFRPFMRETNPGDLPSCCPIVQDFHDVSRTTGLVLSVLRDFGTASSAAITAVIDLDLFQNRMLTQTCQEKKKVPASDL